MFTTAGAAILAMSRNVVAVTGPVSGALFIGRRRHASAPTTRRQIERDAITIPTTDATMAIEQCVKPR